MDGRRHSRPASRALSCAHARAAVRRHDEWRAQYARTPQASPPNPPAQRYTERMGLRLTLMGRTGMATLVLAVLAVPGFLASSASASESAASKGAVVWWDYPAPWCAARPGCAPSGAHSVRRPIAAGVHHESFASKSCHVARGRSGRSPRRMRRRHGEGSRVTPCHHLAAASWPDSAASVAGFPRISG